jgi:hypothetical protein
MLTSRNMIDGVFDLMDYRQQHTPLLIQSMSKGHAGLHVFPECEMYLSVVFKKSFKLN